MLRPSVSELREEVSVPIEENQVLIAEKINGINKRIDLCIGMIGNIVDRSEI
ncbi:MAG: hypothetical protein ACTSUP_07955 [Candidatus Heimdallarchaeaceae archaeon]